MKRDYPFFWVTFSFVTVPGRPPLLVFSRSGPIRRRLVAGTTSGIHARWWHCFYNFSWVSMSFVRRSVTFFIRPLLLFQRASPCAPGSWSFTSVSYSIPGIIPGPRRVLLQISTNFSLSQASPSPEAGSIIPLGGGRGPGKRRLPPGTFHSPVDKRSKVSPSVKGSPRRAAVKTKRQDSLSSSSLRKPKLSQDSDESSSGFDLTPSQSPGPTRPLSELRTDPRIPNDGQPVRIGNTLLPFEGEGLFSLSDIYFPVLQHRQLHRIFWTILCTAMCLLYYAWPSMPLYVSLDCSADGVSPPSGAIRNRWPIL